MPTYNTNGRNAVGGLSSTGGTAVDYAIQAPGLYQAVGSYSGLLTPAAQSAAGLDHPDGRRCQRRCDGVLAGGPLWVAHDPSLNVAKLAGVAVYVAASASGNVGEVDKLPPGFGPNITGGTDRADHRRQHQGIRR